jgi:hypothetical protein
MGLIAAVKLACELLSQQPFTDFQSLMHADRPAVSCVLRRKPVAIVHRLLFTQPDCEHAPARFGGSVVAKPITQLLLLQVSTACRSSGAAPCGRCMFGTPCIQSSKDDTAASPCTGRDLKHKERLGNP